MIWLTKVLNLFTGHPILHDKHRGWYKKGILYRVVAEFYNNVNNFVQKIGATHSIANQRKSTLESGANYQIRMKTNIVAMPSMSYC